MVATKGTISYMVGPYTLINYDRVHYFNGKDFEPVDTGDLRVHRIYQRGGPGDCWMYDQDDYGAWIEHGTGEKEKTGAYAQMTAKEM